MDIVHLVLRFTIHNHTATATAMQPGVTYPIQVWVLPLPNIKSIYFGMAPGMVSRYGIVPRQKSYKDGFPHAAAQKNCLLPLLVGDSVMSGM